MWPTPAGALPSPASGAGRALYRRPARSVSLLVARYNSDHLCLSLALFGETLSSAETLGLLQRKSSAALVASPGRVLSDPPSKVFEAARKIGDITAETRLWRGLWSCCRTALWTAPLLGGRRYSSTEYFLIGNNYWFSPLLLLIRFSFVINSLHCCRECAAVDGGNIQTGGQSGEQTPIIRQNPSLNFGADLSLSQAQEGFFSITLRSFSSSKSVPLSRPIVETFG